MVKTARMIPTETELQEIYEEIYWNNKHNNAVELIAIPGQPLCPELDSHFCLRGSIIVNSVNIEPALMQIIIGPAIKDIPVIQTETFDVV